MKIIITLLAFVLSSAALACWKVEGSLGVDGETWKFSQRFDHNKEYIFPMGSFILKMTLKPQSKKEHTLVYVVQERKEKSITLVTEGDEDVEEGQQREIFAKGKEGQPNSIITIKLIPI